MLYLVKQGYGSEVLSLLEHPEGKRILDLGCGNGALTQKLHEMGAQAIGLDASEAFLDMARSRYPHLVFLQGDAAQFELDAPVDAVFSNALLHWIPAEKQPAMLRCAANALKPGGEFVFECGGQGNTAQIQETLAAVFARHSLCYRMAFFYPGIGEYASLLEAAGFQVRYASLFNRMTPLEGEDGLSDWLRMFIKQPFDGMEMEQKEEILRETVSLLKPSLLKDGVWHADYVRIRCKAIRSDS